MVPDIEATLLTEIQRAVAVKYPNVSVISEHRNKPPAFPCVMFYESNNSTFLQTTDELGEHHAEVSYTCEVYSNDDSRKRSVVKAIAAIVNDAMVRRGFNRLSKSFEYRANDTSIVAITTVYRAVIGESPASNDDVMIYRR